MPQKGMNAEQFSGLRRVGKPGTVWQKAGWRKGEPRRADTQHESRGPEQVCIPLHLQVVQRANRESKQGVHTMEIRRSWAVSNPPRPGFRTLLAKYLSRARG